MVKAVKQRHIPNPNPNPNPNARGGFISLRRTVLEIQQKQTLV